MNVFSHDKIIAAAFCVSAAAAFAGGTPVAHAESVFPPAHLAPGAVFAPSDPATAPARPGTWYRSPANITRGTATPALPDARVAAGLAVTPWYRAAN